MCGREAKHREEEECKSERIGRALKKKKKKKKKKKTALSLSPSLVVLLSLARFSFFRPFGRALTTKTTFSFLGE